VTPSPAARAFAAMQLLLLAVDPAHGESRWSTAHRFDALPDDLKAPGHWYKPADGVGAIRVDEHMNGQWYPEAPPDLDLASVVTIPSTPVVSLFDTMMAIADRELPDSRLAGSPLARNVSNLRELVSAGSAARRTRAFHDAAFDALAKSKDTLRRTIDEAAEHATSDALNDGTGTGRDAAGLLLMRTLAQALTPRLSDLASPDGFKAMRVLGQITAPGASELEELGGRFVRDCLAAGFATETKDALARLLATGSGAIEAAREGYHPVGHPEAMLPIYYVGLFLAAPALRAAMLGYRILASMPGLADKDRKTFSIRANAAEEKLVRVGDALLYAIRDLNGDEARVRRAEIQRRLAAGDKDGAEGLAMELVDLKLFYPKPFKAALLRPDPRTGGG
jgi:hypothetical protein